MKKKATTREMSASSTTAHEIEQTSSELYKVGIYISGACAAMIGVWGLVCLSSAFISTGGPIALLKSMFGATFGAM
ncbi:MAG: hypothetical protein ACI8PB_000299 [Desulforhopalus sp.]